MRTTVNLDDDIFLAARNLAALHRVALGTALSELARAGLRQRVTYPDDGLPAFQVTEKAPTFGLEEVRASEDEI